MPTIKLSVPHRLGADEAKKRIQKMAAEGKQQFGQMLSDVEENWNGNNASLRFKAMGMSVSGRLEVAEADVQVEIDLPFAALPFKGRMKQELRNRAQALLSG